MIRSNRKTYLLQVERYDLTLLWGSAIGLMKKWQAGLQNSLRLVKLAWNLNGGRRGFRHPERTRVLAPIFPVAG